MNKKYLIFGGIQLLFLVLVFVLFVSYEIKLQTIQVLECANSVLYDVNDGEYELLDTLKRSSMEQQTSLYVEKEELDEMVTKLKKELEALEEEKESWEQKLLEIEK